MASVLKASGFNNLESLQDFAMRFPNIADPLDNDLKKIWVCHKTPEEIPKFEELNSLPIEDYYCLSNKIKKKIESAKDFLSLITEFSPLSIFDKIYSQFNKQLSTYLFTKCYLFYNWGISAFEPVLDHFEIHKQIEKSQKMSLRIKQRIVVKDFPHGPNFYECSKRKNQRERREKSVDLFEEPTYSTSSPKSRVSTKALKERIQKAERFYDISKKSNNPYQETFNFKKILYDMKQRPQWSRHHVLSKNNVEDLILFIVHIPVNTSFFIEDKLLNDSTNWSVLRELLGRCIKQHEMLNKNNGYGRILKKHLKSVKTPSNQRLFAIPKTTVCSYTIDILRRVFPLELFGNNCLRKYFFRGVRKVINGMKEQNFIWYPLLCVILKNKSKLAWCSKLETGSSGFGLKFYRKSDMESSSFICLSNLLKNKQIRPLRKQDYDQSSIERNWLETGTVNEEDVKRKLRKTMGHECEYKQPIAHVRFLPKNDEGDELRIITNITQRVPKELNAGSRKLERLFTVRLSWRKKRLFFVKLLLEFLVDKYGFGIRPEPYNPILEATWKKAVHLKESYGELFFIKADISDAFGSVKYDILTKILKKTFQEDSDRDRVQLKRIIEWKRKKWRIEKVVRFSFSNRPRENSIMINRSVFLHHNKRINQYYDSKFLDIIKQVVMMQRVEIKGRVFRLIKGLAQGSAGKFSPQLCEIYYSSMDRICFQEFINTTDSILLRAVDDYLFVTSNLEKARKFLELVHKGIDDYDVRFNNSKLQSNLIENIQQVPYLGLVFNFEDMSVKPNYSKYQHMNVLSTVNLFDRWGNTHFKKDVFLRRRSLHIHCLKLHSIVLNSVHGNLKKFRRIIFEACVMQSLRVITLANYLYCDNVKNDLEVYRILLKSCNKIKNAVDGRLLSREEVRWLFFFAIFNILGRWSGQFKLLFMIIRLKLQRCETALTKVGSGLLLDFLKDDVLEEDYWESVSSVFKELRNTPKFIRASLKKG